ncbi:MAG: tetratricopeptide repeat protein [bacterium]
MIKRLIFSIIMILLVIAVTGVFLVSCAKKEKPGEAGASNAGVKTNTTAPLPTQERLLEENTGAWKNIEKDLRERNLDKAEKNLKEALRKEPDALNYRMGLAQVETLRGNFEEARENLSYMARQNLPIDKKAILVSSLSEAGETDQAVTIARKMLAGGEPVFIPLYLAYAEAFAKKYFLEVQTSGKSDPLYLEEADQVLKKISKMNKEESGPFLIRGFIAFMQGDIPKAEQLFKKYEGLTDVRYETQSLEGGVELRPLYTMMGLCDLSRGDRAAAENHFTGAITIFDKIKTPHYARLFMGDEVLLMAMNVYLGKRLSSQKLEEAEKKTRLVLTQSGIQVPPGPDVRAFLIKLVSLREKGDIMGAESLLNQFKQELSSSRVPAMGYYGTYLALHARPFLETAIQVYMGDFYAEKKMKEESRRAYEEALKIEPWNQIIREKLKLPVKNA